MDSAPFKSPRPPAPRKARGGTLSRQSSRQSLRDSFNGNEEAVPPLPTASMGLGLGMMNHHAGDVDNPIRQQQHNNNNSDNNDDTETLLQNGYTGSSITAAVTQHSNRETSANTTAAVLAKLEGLLVAKSNEIQLAGRLGEALLSQQAELESRIRELEDEVRKSEDHAEIFGGKSTTSVSSSSRETRQHYHNGSKKSSNNDEDDSDVESAALVDERVKEKLRELESEMFKWEKGNEEIYKEVGVPSGTSSELVRQASSASMVSTQSTIVTARIRYAYSIHSAPNSQLPHLYRDQTRRTHFKTRLSSMPILPRYLPLSLADSVMLNTEPMTSNLRPK